MATEGRRAPRRHQRTFSGAHLRPGGLFYFNYPGGTGLMNGAMFGRIAGTSAGQRAAQSR